MSNYPFQSIKVVIAPWTGNTKKPGKILWILETVCTAFDYAAPKHLLSGTYSCWILGGPEEEEVLLQPCPQGAVTQQLQHYSKCLWQMEMSYGLSEECQQENHSPDPQGFWSKPYSLLSSVFWETVPGLILDPGRVWMPDHGHRTAMELSHQSWTMC